MQASQADPNISIICLDVTGRRSSPSWLMLSVRARIALAFEYPDILAVHGLDGRRTVLDGFREMPHKCISRLDDMVVDAHQN